MQKLCTLWVMTKYVQIEKLSANKTEILKIKVTKDKVSPYICPIQSGLSGGAKIFVYFCKEFLNLSI